MRENSSGDYGRIFFDFIRDCSLVGGKIQREKRRESVLQMNPRFEKQSIHQREIHPNISIEISFLTTIILSPR